MTDEEKTALDELKGSVATLVQGVEDMKEGLVDEETVQRIAAEVVKQQLEANPSLIRQGYKPGDDDGTDDPPAGAASAVQGAERLHLIQSLSPSVAEKRLRVKADDVAQFHTAADNVAMLNVLCGVSQGLPKDVRDTKYWNEVYSPLVQAMDTSTAGEGLEFIPTELSSSLIDRVNLELRVAALFNDVQMPTNPWELPGRAVARQRLGTKAEETADTGQGKFLAVTPGSRKVTLTAVKFGGRALVSKEAEEDSIIAMLPYIQSELVDFLAADVEDAIINGDSTNPHQDSDVTDFTDPQDPRTGFNGLRNLTAAGAKTDLSNAAPTVANSLRANRTKMGKYGIGIGDLAHVLSISAYMQLLDDTNVYTVDKYGAGATILAGELGRADGTPLIVSEFVRQDLNASGVHDGVTTDRTLVITVNRRGWLIGRRRSMQVQLFRELYAESDQDAVQVSHRMAFAALYPTATEFLVGQTYNVNT